MTFELAPEHLGVRDRARAFAARLQAHATDIDRASKVPVDLAQGAEALCIGDPLAVVLAVEELATASAAVATTSVGTSRVAEPFGMAGLRGADQIDDTPRSQLALAAVALGIGRSALAAALAELRQSIEAPATDVEKPHWAVADAATELDAARLLTYKAATTMADADIAVARLMASAAAVRAVDTALRIVGPAALSDGATLERLSRDVRAVSLVLGTEERHRAVAAERLLPR